MDEPEKLIGVFVLTMESEMQIGSTLLFLDYYLQRKIGKGYRLYVIDNSSRDRTVKIARKCGVTVSSFKEDIEWSEVIKSTLTIAKESGYRTLVLLDLTGGNREDDAISLISRSIKEDERFASAYIRPSQNVGSIGCWAIDRGLLSVMGNELEVDIEQKLVNLASKEDLELLSIEEKISLNSKRKRRRMFRLFRRSPLETLSIIMRYHPLKFYGSIGMMMLLTAIGTGFYTIDFIYKNGELNYFPAFTTVALVMIGGFFMVAGLILNALNTLVEKLEAMKKWVE